MMRSMLPSLALLLAAPFAQAADAQWLVTTDLWGNPAYQLLTLPDQQGPLQGRFDGDALQGTREGETLAFVVTGSDGATYRFHGTQAGATLRGTADYPDTNASERRATHPFSAPAGSAGRRSAAARLRAYLVRQRVLAPPRAGTDRLAG